MAGFPLCFSRWVFGGWKLRERPKGKQERFFPPHQLFVVSLNQKGKLRKRKMVSISSTSWAKQMALSSRDEVDGVIVAEVMTVGICFGICFDAKKEGGQERCWTNTKHSHSTQQSTTPSSRETPSLSVPSLPVHLSSNQSSTLVLPDGTSTTTEASCGRTSRASTLVAEMTRRRTRTTSKCCR